MTDKPQKPSTAQKRRIVLPKREESKVQVINDTDLLLNDAKVIIAAELAHYRSKASRGISLDLKEARVIQGYLDSLTKLQKEEREQARAEDLSNLSDEELMQLAAKVLGATQPSLTDPEEE